jgi:hypothetical protein
VKFGLFVFLAVALLCVAAPSFAATCGPTDSTTCTVTVSPDDTTAVFDFTQGSNGRLVVQFETVLTTFDLIVKLNHTIDNFDSHEFPPGTVCVPYSGNGPQCTQYDFSGTATTGGFMGVPVKNKDYKGLITLTLSYDNATTIHNPAFAHAPGDITVFTEDILTSYFDTSSDPTMGGKTPGLSSVVAADEPFTETGDTFCSLTLTPTNNPSEDKAQIEVTLKIVSGSNCAATGLRDKTARLSVALSTFDSYTGEDIITFPAIRNVEGNKFHWDSKAGLNEYDISLDGLTPGQQYTITVFSSKISPRTATFTVPN